MENTAALDHLPWVIAAAVAGGAVVWLLARLEHRILSVDDPHEDRQRAPDTETAG